MPARPGYLYNHSAPPPDERAEIKDLLEELELALEITPKQFASLEPHYQLTHQAFQHETLGRCLRFRAEHDLF